MLLVSHEIIVGSLAGRRSKELSTSLRANTDFRCGELFFSWLLGLRVRLKKWSVFIFRITNQQKSGRFGRAHETGKSAG